jgi:hypothetical protein
MAREVTKTEQYTHKPHKFALKKERTEIHCDDGTTYIFERASDEPAPRLVRGEHPDGSVTHTNTSGRLPSAVKETAEAVLDGWSK